MNPFSFSRGPLDEPLMIGAGRRRTSVAAKIGHEQSTASGGSPLQNPSGGAANYSGEYYNNNVPGDRRGRTPDAIASPGVSGINNNGEPQHGRRAKTVDPNGQRERMAVAERQAAYHAELKRQVDEERARKQADKEARKRDEEALELRAIQERQKLGQKESEEQRKEGEAKQRAEQMALVGRRAANRPPPAPGAVAIPAAGPPPVAVPPTNVANVHGRRNPNETAPSALDGQAKFGRRADGSVIPLAEGGAAASKEQQYREQLKRQSEEAKERKRMTAERELLAAKEYDARMERWAQSDKPLGGELMAPLPPRGVGGPQDGREHQPPQAGVPFWLQGDVAPPPLGQPAPGPSPRSDHSGSANDGGAAMHTPRDGYGAAAYGAPPYSVQPPMYVPMAFSGGLPASQLAAAAGAPGGASVANLYPQGLQGMFSHPGFAAPLTTNSASSAYVPASNTEVAMLRQEILTLLTDQRRDMEDLRGGGAAGNLYAVGGPQRLALVAASSGVSIPTPNITAPPPAHRSQGGGYGALVARDTRYGETQQLLDRFLREDEARREESVAQIFSRPGGQHVPGGHDGLLSLGAESGGGNLAIGSAITGSDGGSEPAGSNIDLCGGLPASTQFVRAIAPAGRQKGESSTSRLS